MLLTLALLAACGPTVVEPGDRPDRPDRPDPEDPVDPVEPPPPESIDPNYGSPGDAAGAAFFADDVVHTVDLELSDEAIASLDREPKTYVEGAVTLDGTRFDNIGVRGKGSSTAQTFDGKPSLKLDLNRYVDQDLDGLELVMLHGLIIDQTQMHEAMAWKVAQMWGLPYSRVSYVRMTVNGIDYGLYANIEAHDDEWMDRTFADGDEGRLYEGGYPLYPEAWDHADFSRGEVKNFDLEEGEDVDHADLLATMEELADTSSPDWMGRVQPRLDLDAFVRFVAVEAWIGQWDGYAYASNNFRVYVDSTGQAEFILSGLDWTFTEGGDWANPSMPVAYACRQDDACSAALDAAFEDLCTNLDTEALLAERARIWDLIDDQVADDPRSPISLRTAREQQDTLNRWLNDRSASLLETWQAGGGGWGPEGDDDVEVDEPAP